MSNGYKQRVETMPDPQLAALQALASRARGGAPETDEDAPVVTAEDPDAIRAKYTQAVQPSEMGATRGPLVPAYVPQGSMPAAQPTAQPQAQQPAVAPREREWDGWRAMTALGGGDVSAYDARQVRFEDAPQRDFAFKQAQTDAAFANEQHALQQQQLREAMSPESATSRDAQNQFRASMNTLGNLPGMTPEAKAQFADFAEKASGMTAAQIAKAQLNIQPLVGNILKSAGTQANADLAGKKMAISEEQLQATINNQKEGHQIQRASLSQADQHFQDELARKTAADAMRAKAGRLRLQTKSVDKKATEELQNIEAMNGQLGDIEQNLDKAITGPGVGTAMAAEGVANSSLGKAVGLDKAFDALTPAGTKEGLAATRNVQSGIEQAIAEMKLKRHGASFTASEQKVVDKWSPGVKFGKEDNALLAGALRKYMASRGQQRILQVFKETGLPIELPAGKQLSMEDVSKLKSLYEGVDKYSDEDVAGVADRADEILSAYGGRVATTHNHKATAKQAADSGKAERARRALADPNASAKAKAGAQAYLDSIK